MRRYVFITIFGFLLGCSNSDSDPLDAWMAESGQVKVLSTTAMIDSVVEKVGKEHIDRMTLITGEIDPHSYELVKGDDEKFARAHLVIANGLGLEHAASINYRMKAHPHVLYMGDAIAKRRPEKILVIDGQTDPHIWMDISLWKEGVDAIVDALSKEDPTHAEVFVKNGAEAKEEMMRTHLQLQQKMGTVPQERRYLVTSHDAFNYFGRAYLSHEGDCEKRVEAPEGLAPEGQLSASDIISIVNHLKKHAVRVVFPESNVSSDSLKKISSACKSKGIEVRVSPSPLYGDAMGPKGSDGDTYLKMIEHNINVLCKEWQ